MEKLNKQFEDKCAEEKQKYYENIVCDLKDSKISLWYSKVKRMAGQNQQNDDIMVDELIGITDLGQAERIADHYASISNLYEPLKSEDFSRVQWPKNILSTQNISGQIAKIILKMNKKAAGVPGDLPMRIIAQFSDQFSRPLAQLINTCF